MRHNQKLIQNRYTGYQYNNNNNNKTNCNNMNKTLLDKIAAYMDKGDYVINDTIDHLTKSGVTVGEGKVIDGGHAAFRKVRDEIVTHYRIDRDIGESRATAKTIEFLDECGYRLRKKRVTKVKKVNPEWKKAKAEKVRRAVEGDNIMVGGIEYAPVK